MALISRLDRVMADRKIKLKDLCEIIDMSPVNISRIRTGRVKSIRLVTLERLCRALDCTPSDIFEIDPTEPEGLVYMSPFTDRKPKRPAKEG